MTEFVQLSTTTAAAEEANAIAQGLLEKQLAACVQIISQVRSVYRWQGNIEHADECLCLVKTRRSLLTRVEEEICRQHSYECPEIIAVPIESASEAYLSWMDAQLND